MQIRLHGCGCRATFGVTKAEKHILKIRPLREEDAALLALVDLVAQDEMGFAEILDAVLALETVLDALDLVEVWRDEEEIVDVEGNVVILPPLAPDVGAGVRLGE